MDLLKKAAFHNTPLCSAVNAPRKLILKGRHDAHAWAMTMGLVPTRVEAGNELQPVPGEGAVQKEIAAAAGKTVLTELQRAKNL
eukprot:1158502-Pelagomonas_calceolata.AAC.2